MKSHLSIAIRRLQRRSRLQELRVESAEAVCREAADAERIATTAVREHGARLEAASQQLVEKSTSPQPINVRALEVHMQAWNSLVAWGEHLAAEQSDCRQTLQDAQDHLRLEQGKHSVLERVLEERLRKRAQERDVAEAMEATDIWTAGRYFRHEH